MAHISKREEPYSNINPRCPKCHNSLELPPSLQTLQASNPPAYVTFNTTIDRTVPICRHCAYNAAKEAGTVIPSPQDLKSARKVIEDKLEEPYELLQFSGLAETFKAQLKFQIAKWELEKIQLKDMENQVKAYNEVKNLMVEATDLIGKGVCVEELKKVRAENLLRRDAFEDMLERKGFQPYWAIWGYNGERLT